MSVEGAKTGSIGASIVSIRQPNADFFIWKESLNRTAIRRENNNDNREFVLISCASFNVRVHTRVCISGLRSVYTLRVRPHYARFVVIRVLFVKKIVSELTPIDTNIKRRVQIRRICPFALFANPI